MAYAVQGTQVTWECYRKLVERYDKLQLTTPVHRIYSEASLGKATLIAMGVRPWREVQSNIPPELLGIILSTYYGGRSEVRIRREVRQVVLCDFLSMYPTVCTLMGLWRFVIAKGMSWQDDTEAVRTFLGSTTTAALQRQVTWRDLSVLVEVAPTAGILPVRADYDGTGSTTIGLNVLTSDRPQWFTLADCLASKLLSGRAPNVVRAIRFTPLPMQDSLRSININGDPAHPVDPCQGDFYKRLIELRHDVKIRRDAAIGFDRMHLELLQYALKIMANATSYGIFAEVNVADLSEPQVARVHGGSGMPFDVKIGKAGGPGRFFHPLVATLITGAARLMLALAERLVTDARLHWAFCDTDSMAIARPESLNETVFYERVDAVVSWFASLNPYAFKGLILKIEDANASLSDAGRREALFCYAVSAKRYVLSNDGGNHQPVLRKASAHGLGHLREPNGENQPATGIPTPAVRLDKLGVALWQHDLWWMIARAALSGPVVQLPLTHHPAMQAPAVSRYAATTPQIHRWFGPFNDGKSLDAQVKPFGFMLAFSSPRGSKQRPVSPFDRDHDKAASAAFDRITGEQIKADALQSYASALAQYHLFPEAKFLNGDFLDKGTTKRRHVIARGHVFIGKEADRWEERFFLGLDAEALVTYGSAQTLRQIVVLELATAKEAVGERQLANRLGIARETLRGMLGNGADFGSDQLWSSVEARLQEFWAEEHREQELLDRTMAILASWVERGGPTAVAHQLGTNASNLVAVLRGRRRMSDGLKLRLSVSEQASIDRT